MAVWIFLHSCDLSLSFSPSENMSNLIPVNRSWVWDNKLLVLRSLGHVKELLCMGIKIWKSTVVLLSGNRKRGKPQTSLLTFFSASLPSCFWGNPTYAQDIKRTLGHSSELVTVPGKTVLFMYCSPESSTLSVTPSWFRNPGCILVVDRSTCVMWNNKVMVLCLWWCVYDVKRTAVCTSKDTLPSACWTPETKIDSMLDFLISANISDQFWPVGVCCRALELHSSIMLIFKYYVTEKVAFLVIETCLFLCLCSQNTLTIQTWRISQVAIRLRMYVSTGFTCFPHTANPN